MAGVPETIKVGILDDMNGPFAASSGRGCVVAARMAAEDLAGQGGRGRTGCSAPSRSGRREGVVHDRGAVRVETPAASKSRWDVYDGVAREPANEAFRPLNQGGCRLVAQQGMVDGE